MQGRCLSCVASSSGSDFGSLKREGHKANKRIFSDRCPSANTSVVSGDPRRCAPARVRPPESGELKIGEYGMPPGPSSTAFGLNDETAPGAGSANSFLEISSSRDSISLLAGEPSNVEEQRLKKLPVAAV